MSPVLSHLRATSFCIRIWARGTRRSAGRSTRCPVCCNTSGWCSESRRESARPRSPTSVRHITSWCRSRRSSEWTPWGWAWGRSLSRADYSLSNRNDFGPRGIWSFMLGSRKWCGWSWTPTPSPPTLPRCPCLSVHLSLSTCLFLGLSTCQCLGLGTCLSPALVPSLRLFLFYLGTTERTDGTTGGTLDSGVPPEDPEDPYPDLFGSTDPGTSLPSLATLGLLGRSAVDR